jgi:hypothetical protein
LFENEFDCHLSNFVPFGPFGPILARLAGMGAQRSKKMSDLTAL